MKFNIAQTVPISGHVSMAAVAGERSIPSNSIEVVQFHQNYHGNMDIDVYAGDATNLPIVDEEPRAWALTVTDKFKYWDDGARDTLLLPCQYQLRFDHYDMSGTPSGNVQVCYENGDAVEGVSYTIEYSPTTMWTDWRDNGTGMSYRYDRTLTWGDEFPGSGACRVRLLLPEYLCYTEQTYFVKYDKVRKVSAGAAIDSKVDVSRNHMEVINPSGVYEYGPDYVFNGTQLSLPGASLINSLANCQVKRADVNRVRVALPKAGRREGWFPRVWLGTFEDADGIEYYIPEGYAAAYGSAVNWAVGGNPKLEPSCGFAIFDEATTVESITGDSNWIVVKETPLHFRTTKYPNYLPYNIYEGYRTPDITDVDSNPNTNHGINVYVNDVRLGAEQILDWDIWNGRINVGRMLTRRDKVNVTYLHEQRYYTFQVPDVCSQVHHMKPPGESYAPTDDAIVVVLIPAGTGLAWYYKSDNPSDIYDGTYSGYPTGMSDPFPAAPAVVLAANTIKLAEISVKYGSPSTSTTIYDSRRRGGGIFEDAYFPVTRVDGTTRESIQEESNYYTDIGLYDGQGLKKDAVLIVEIPLAKLNEVKDNIISAGYNITDDEAHQQAIQVVRDVIDANVAIGVFYVLVDENGDLWPTVSP